MWTDRQILVQRVPLGFLPVNLTMLHAGACESWGVLLMTVWSFQVKIILLCINILPNAFKIRKKDKKDLDAYRSRLVGNACLILLESWSGPSALSRTQSKLLNRLSCVHLLCVWMDRWFSFVPNRLYRRQEFCKSNFQQTKHTHMYLGYAN